MEIIKKCSIYMWYGILLLIFLLAPIAIVFAEAQEAPAPPPPCTSDEYRQFDFWLGTWIVSSAASPQSKATNNISAIQGGCVMLEEYEAGGFTGMSLNFYDQSRKVWHQTWISNQGGPLYLEGGLNNNGEMVLSDQTLPASEASGKINRITWTPNANGSVRQFWQTSTDDGKTWSTAFDGLYVRQG